MTLKVLLDSWPREMLKHIKEKYHICKIGRALIAAYYHYLNFPYIERKGIRTVVFLEGSTEAAKLTLLMDPELTTLRNPTSLGPYTV